MGGSSQDVDAVGDARGLRCRRLSAGPCQFSSAGNLQYRRESRMGVSEFQRHESSSCRHLDRMWAVREDIAVRQLQCDMSAPHEATACHSAVSTADATAAAAAAAAACHLSCSSPRLLQCDAGHSSRLLLPHVFRSVTSSRPGLTRGGCTLESSGDHDAQTSSGMSRQSHTTFAYAR
jgi:hypothetical protein